MKYSPDGECGWAGQFLLMRAVPTLSAMTINDILKISLMIFWL